MNHQINPTRPWTHRGGRISAALRQITKSANHQIRMGTAFLYDGTVDGLLCAVARAIKSRDENVVIHPRENYQKTFFDDDLYVSTDREQIDSLWKYLRCELKKDSVRHILNAVLYDSPDRDMAIYQYIRASLRYRKTLDNYLTDDAVRNMHEISYKVGHEAHRFLGLLRFRQMKSGVLYAPFNPDHRVIYSVAYHFKSRLGGEKWIIHDLSHQMAVYWDGNDLQDADLSREFVGAVSSTGLVHEKWLHEEEKEIQHLWHVFFDNIAIAARNNPRLQRNLLPRRYWKCLVEMQPRKSGGSGPKQTE